MTICKFGKSTISVVIFHSKLLVNYSFPEGNGLWNLSDAGVINKIQISSGDGLPHIRPNIAGVGYIATVLGVLRLGQNLNRVKLVNYPLVLRLT